MAYFNTQKRKVGQFSNKQITRRHHWQRRPRRMQHINEAIGNNNKSKQRV